MTFTVTRNIRAIEKKLDGPENYIIAGNQMQVETPEDMAKKLMVVWWFEGGRTWERVIEVKHLSKSFGDHKVLRDIDFSVNKGEVVCIYGFIWIRKINIIKMYKSF